MYAYLLTNYPPLKTTPPAPRPRKRRGPGLLRRVLRAVIRDWQRKRTVAALRQLDDHLLRDIGLCRGDIPRIVTDMDAPRPRAANPASRRSA